MPHALTKRQREYLDFIRAYIQENEWSPRLEEVARHFGVKPPTAHKTLEALQRKGYILFERSSKVGFYIRVAERAGFPEVIVEVPIFGRINAYGEIYDFPTDIGGFPDVFSGATPHSIFALLLTEEIPNASMLPGDNIVFDLTKKPQSGDICIADLNDRLILIQVASRTLDRRFISFETSVDFPIPEDLMYPEHDPLLNWYPLAYDETDERWQESFGEWEIPIPPEYILATALRLYRTPTCLHSY